MAVVIDRPKDLTTDSSFEQGRTALNSLLAEFQQDVVNDRLPTEAYVRGLVVEACLGDLNATRELLKSHKGLVAAVVHEGMSPQADPAQLLKIGVTGLLHAVKHHGTAPVNGETPFSDVAIITIQQYLGTQATHAYSAPLTADSPPTLRIINYAAQLEEISPPINDLEAAFKAFSPLQRKIAPLIHLSYDEIAKNLGLEDKHAIKDAVRHIKKKLARDPRETTRVGAAVRLQELGLQYKVPILDKPLTNILTNIEIDIGNLLHIPYEKIAEKLSLNPSVISRKVIEMKEKTGTSTTAELALLIAKYDTGERSEEKTLTRLDKLASKLGLESVKDVDWDDLFNQINNANQRKAVELYFPNEGILWKDVGAQLGVSANTACAMASRGIIKMHRALAGKH